MGAVPTVQSYPATFQRASSEGASYVVMTVPGGYQYSSCRLLGHSWHEVPSDWEPAFGVPMTVRCERCDMERRDTVGRNTGFIESRRYVYPTGYEITTEEGYDRPARLDFRLDRLEHHVAQIEAQTKKARGKKAS